MSEFEDHLTDDDLSRFIQNANSHRHATSPDLVGTVVVLKAKDWKVYGILKAITQNSIRVGHPGNIILFSDIVGSVRNYYTGEVIVF